MYCARAGDRAPTAAAIIEVFNGEFAERENTVLCGGADEPMYEPAAAAASGRARISFRADYASSALHEVAHWCIAGRSRRDLPDYGYWYAPDGRSARQQAQFLEVEARPQALEWCFSQASGLRFRVSLDNLDEPPDGRTERCFGDAVVRAALRLRADGLPPRGERFLVALARRFRPAFRRADLLFSPDYLS